MIWLYNWYAYAIYFIHICYQTKSKSSIYKYMVILNPKFYHNIITNPFRLPTCKKCIIFCLGYQMGWGMMRTGNKIWVSIYLLYKIHLLYDDSLRKYMCRFTQSITIRNTPWHSLYQNGPQPQQSFNNRTLIQYEDCLSGYRISIIKIRRSHLHNGNFYTGNTA